MGGFQKYPIPRYMNTSMWVVNRNWKWNTFHMLVPTFFLSFLCFRNFSVSTVTPPQPGEYIDPKSQWTPKILKY
ncbi:hypothetical protein IMG5_019420 [Ichthyophthirius multifiliis]|uniref:Transmembrane protein n=1 Tax=Ichthyophthirius multifiliis TaxID=5932 RepID=G0QKL7_ICHMU|nr:hypothetical protein IMG5_019420 [Ichthyophthirius multifiliis]EGR34235.1 hypothetical protein IMG5_019420 [Ichthyophthirius multifiliis]|eukprot:XP_004039539.1 hypothetical protein IMG5_019420 [Ichthyophthirius multifiliis]